MYKYDLHVYKYDIHMYKYDIHMYKQTMLFYKQKFCQMANYIWLEIKNNIAILLIIHSSDDFSQIYLLLSSFQTFTIETNMYIAEEYKNVKNRFYIIQ